MAPKRSHAESEGDELVHPSRQAQVPGAIPKPAKKPRRFEPPVHKKQLHASSVNAIKKKIRDVTRRLERSEDIPANVRIDAERALAAYQQELADAEAQKLRNKMIGKYHMVRFFERQKATRQLKKLRKRILEAASTNEVEALKTQLHVAEVDLNYTQYCPLNEPYVSLYPLRDSAKEEDQAEKDTTKSKPPMWAEVEKCMEEGTLNKLRNRAAPIQVNTSKPLQIKPAKTPKIKLQPSVDTTVLNRRERRRAERGAKEGKGKNKNKSIGFEKNKAFGAAQAAEKYARDAVKDDDSDGGFFEE